MKNILAVASISGLLCVTLGAIGAHALKELLSENMLHAWEKGVQYQFYHTLALLFSGMVLKTEPSKKLKMVSLFFVAGIILFSGSLYLLALTSINQHPWNWLGPVTPIGGLCFMLGWLFLILHYIKK